jgi:hypothetical protein
MDRSAQGRAFDPEGWQSVLMRPMVQMMTLSQSAPAHPLRKVLQVVLIRYGSYRELVIPAPYFPI